MTDEYRRDLIAGQEYQDFIADQLREQLGIVISVYSSKKYQIEKGETAQGIEIKYDSRLVETRNLYIEVAERSHPNGKFVPGGICRDDNTWLFLIGNYEEAFIFFKEFLLYVWDSHDFCNEFHIVEVEKPTSKGFLLPKDYFTGSRKRYAKHLVFKKAGD